MAQRACSSAGEACCHGLGGLDSWQVSHRQNLAGGFEKLHKSGVGKGGRRQIVGQ